MSRIRRVLALASLSAVSLSTLTLAAPSLAAGSGSAAPTEYVVKNGDFLAGIAAKVHVALPDLLSANKLTPKSLILPGDKLVVPAGSAAPVNSPSAGPVAGSLVYTVKSGDFLLGIATSYKVTLADLLAVNKITIQSLILPGRNLVLPANAVAPQAASAVVPAAAAAPTTTAPTVSSVTYTVKFGDFLAGIAAAYKVKLSDLLAVNKMTAASLILPGATLAMPANAVEPAAPPAQVQSTVGPAGVIVAYAYAQLGKPYRFFTAGPDTFDCSGLVKAAYAQIGMVLIHHAASQATLGTAIDFWSEPIAPGDLVFMATRGDHTVINHVGIAVDATHWIHAPAPGDVVRLAPIPPKGILTTVRRLIP
ncbi:MAG TPA: LysM peptidoglycan-binding domain-containing protein [Ilumatobacteraceae bacterium]|nr:LysM peptidoglycan-binding domain-containing protein [Ilumatobacteraceae bacterium]